MKRAYEYSVASQVWALKEFGNVGPRTFRALMAYFGNLAAILEADADELNKLNGFSDKKALRVANSFHSLSKAEVFINSLHEREIGYCTIFDDNYPSLFMELNDPPPIIFYRGELPQIEEKPVSIVGSHRATGEGIALAVELASRLAKESVSIVSGLARGIDTAAHIGALKGNGKTYAVLGTGFDNIQPEENRPLAAEITKNGGLISEYAPNVGYSASQLIARNRLTAGLSQAVVIGEIFSDSNGTMDTASFCQETGKIMFILIDNYGQEGHDNGGVEKVLAMGAIPISLSSGVDIIIKSLV